VANRNEGSDDPWAEGRAAGRRSFLKKAALGGTVAALGWWWIFDDELTRTAAAQTRRDGKPRLPPGQRVIRALRPMGGEAGDERTSAFRLRVHGECDAPFQIDFAELLALPQTELAVDVHCVTRWSVMGARFRGVRVRDLAERARVRRDARHVIFEAAHGYTAATR
jgi:DMSO/TMAO reductase YedYZ molybdopterin-dependent catalytic subunit